MTPPSTLDATRHAGDRGALVDALVAHGHSRGQLAMHELRSAFADAGVTTSEGKHILKALSVAGVTLASDGPPVRAPCARPRPPASPRPPSRRPDG